MAITINNVTTLSLLNILNATQRRQDAVLFRMATGSKINRGADDPAGLVALATLDSELIAVNAGITSNQRTDAMLSVADNSLMEIGNLIDEIQRLASESANDAALTADEIAANQSQIDDALASIDRIVQTTNFSGTKLLDGSLGIDATIQAAIGTDLKVFSRKPGSTSVTLQAKVISVASAAQAIDVMTSTTDQDSTFSIQGKEGTAIIDIATGEALTSVRDKIIAAAGQTGLSAHISGGALHIRTTDTGTDAFVRTKLIEGALVSDVNDVGVDAVVTVNGMSSASDGDHVAFSGNGISLTFEIAAGAAAGATGDIVINGDSSGRSGATFQLGTNSNTRATLGLNSVFTYYLGTAAGGYLASLRSGGANDLLTNPSQAADVARIASQQVATVQGRIGGFQKFQVRTAINSLSNTKEGLETARGVIRDVDYATESAEMNRVNVLLQAGISLLGLANQQSMQILALLG